MGDIVGLLAAVGAEGMSSDSRLLVEVELEEVVLEVEESWSASGVAIPRILAC